MFLEANNPLARSSSWQTLNNPLFSYALDIFFRSEVAGFIKVNSDEVNEGAFRARNSAPGKLILLDEDALSKYVMDRRDNSQLNDWMVKYMGERYMSRDLSINFHSTESKTAMMVFDMNRLKTRFESNNYDFVVAKIFAAEMKNALEKFINQAYKEKTNSSFLRLFRFNSRTA